MRLTYWHHRLQNTKLYWSARKRVRYLLFRAKALLFVFARKKQTFGENLRHFLFLIQVVSTGAVSSFAFVALSNVLIHTIPENLSFEIFSTTVYIDNIFNLRKELGFRDDLFVMAQVAGVFLGLYFTAVTVVVGTTYANLRNEIRNLIWRDSTNRLYMAALAFLGGLCITQAIFLSVGLSINTITYIFSLALILVAIFGFIPMSVRVFQFFNPTILVKAYAVPDFLKFAERACVDGERWDDPNFQNHYGEEAQNRLAIISNAVEIACANPEIWKSSYSDLSVSIASLLKNYCIKKKKIPSGSYWYRTYLGHKSWFSVDASEADIAAQLGSRLPPKKRLHRQWVEDNMTRLLNRLVDRAFADNDFSKIYDISLTMQNVFITFSENGAIKEAHDMWHQFTKPTLKKLETIAKPQSESEQGLFPRNSLSA